MFNKLFKRNQNVEKKTIVGRQAELVHDTTKFQYGTVFIDQVRYSVKTNDGSELCKGTMVEVVEEKGACLIVKKVC